MHAVTRRLQRFLAWLAIFGVAFSALLPALASAQPARPGIPVVICTPAGFKTISALTDGGNPAEAPHHTGKVYCALCAMAGDLPVPVPALVTPSVATTAPVSAIEPFLAPLPAPPRLSPPAQAPPQLS
jgi:hypothetical protein